MRLQNTNWSGCISTAVIIMHNVTYMCTVSLMSVCRWFCQSEAGLPCLDWRESGHQDNGQKVFRGWWFCDFVWQFGVSFSMCFFLIFTSVLVKLVLQHGGHCFCFCAAQIWNFSLLLSVTAFVIFAFYSLSQPLFPCWIVLKSPLQTILWPVVLIAAERERERENTQSLFLSLIALI